MGPALGVKHLLRGAVLEISPAAQEPQFVPFLAFVVWFLQDREQGSLFSFQEVIKYLAYTLQGRTSDSKQTSTRATVRSAQEGVRSGDLGKYGREGKGGRYVLWVWQADWGLAEKGFWRAKDFQEKPQKRF